MAFTNAENGAGKDLGREQLLVWARESPVESPKTFGEELLKRLTVYRGNRRNDDETLVVLQPEEESAAILALGQGSESPHLQPSS